MLYLPRLHIALKNCQKQVCVQNAVHDHFDKGSNL